MGIFNYNITSCLGSFDFGSHIRCAEIPTKLDCSRETLMPHFGDCLCDNDSPYCQPVEFGDTLYFQFAANSKAFSKIDILDQTGAILIDDATLNYTFETFSVEENQYDNIQIPFDSQFNDVDCFTIRFEFGDISINPVEFFTITSNQYCRTTCNEKTLVIQSKHLIDCFGLAYPPSNEGGFGFNNSYRVFGQVERISYGFSEREFNEDNELVTQDFDRNYLLRITRPVPGYVADIIGLIISGRDIFVDSEMYTVRSGFQKTTAFGGNWVISIPLYKRCDLDSLSCIT